MTDHLPDPRAQRVSDALHKALGCRLLYHRGRQTYIVFRPRGPMTPPQIYLDVGNRAEPPFPALIPPIREAVSWADSKMTGNFERMLEIAETRMAQKSDEDQDTFIDEWLPDYMKDMRRFREILEDGRVGTKYLDLGKSQVTSQA